MTEYIAECNARSSDRVVARADGSSVELEMCVSDEYKGEAYLTPAKARTFARGILALADEIDGGEVEEAPKPAPKIGDRVRVLKDDSYGFREGEFVGLVGTLKRVSPYSTENGFEVQFGDGSGRHGDKVNGTWNCEAVELVDEPQPEPLADWERDLLEASDATPARSSRAAYVEEARRLMDGTGADADHIIAVAQFLAAGE